jgi:Fe-S cluster assembly iron-binding protein IscA
VALALDEPSERDLVFEVDGLPFLIARHDARYLGAMRVDWLGFLLARPTACRSE